MAHKLKVFNSAAAELTRRGGREWERKDGMKWILLLVYKVLVLHRISIPVVELLQVSVIVAHCWQFGGCPAPCSCVKVAVTRDDR